MTNQTPLRIVERDDSLSDWLFGERFDDHRLSSGDCRTLAVLKLDDARSLYIALTADFDWICDHCDVPLYSDWTHIVVELVSKFEIGDPVPSFASKVSLKRSAESPEPAVESDEYGDIHKLGGESYWLHCNPTPRFQFIGQIAFPGADDLLLDLDWPTGEMTLEIHYDTIGQVHCVLWRMHA
ncbi:MAG: hypothetical protein V4689_21950 [Verrucomicrobiota bacterium]